MFRVRVSVRVNDRVRFRVSVRVIVMVRFRVRVMFYDYWLFVSVTGYCLALLVTG